MNRSDDIKGLILQYPVINPNENYSDKSPIYNVNRFRNKVLIMQICKDKIVSEGSHHSLCNYYNTDYAGKTEIIFFRNQPHIFTGIFKVKAAEEIYRFISKGE